MATNYPQTAKLKQKTKKKPPKNQKKAKNHQKLLDKRNKRDILCNISGGRLAQSVEQGTENPRVPSSILGPATIFFAFFLKAKKNNEAARLHFTEPSGYTSHLHAATAALH